MKDRNMPLINLLLLLNVGQKKFAPTGPDCQVIVCVRSQQMN